MRRLTNVIGFDDGPFERGAAGPVPVAGAVYADLRLDGILLTRVERDGTDATRRLAELVLSSRFREHARLLMLQGVSFGGFNVVDARSLSERLGLPVLIVARREPDLHRVRRALQRLPDGEKKWRLIEGLGPMEPAGRVWIQRVGLQRDEALWAVEHFSIHSSIPEPIRTAHLVAGAVSLGESRGRP